MKDLHGIDLRGRHTKLFNVFCFKDGSFKVRAGSTLSDFQP